MNQAQRAVPLAKALDLLHRRLLLWLGPDAEHLTPHAAAGPDAPTAVLVLQAGPNPTVDYFIWPRLEASGAELRWEIVNLDTPPHSVLLASQAGVHVIVCRYINPAWLDFLERHDAQLHGVTYLVDDDLPAMLRDRTIPASARGRIVRDYARHRPRLERLATSVWTTSRALADVMPHQPERILDPCPDKDPPLRGDRPPPLVVYHGGATHGAERRFALEIARLLERNRPDIRFEIADPQVRRLTRRASNTELAPCVDWESYARAQQGRHVAVMLAPLFDTAVNRVRAPVKFFDATRLGAAGLYADAPAYREFVQPDHDGVLLPMNVPVWAEAVERLIDDEALRGRLVSNAQHRVRAMRRATRAMDFEDHPP